MKQAAAGRIIGNYCHEQTPPAPWHEPRLCPLEGIRAVLFDVYGTLLISKSCFGPLAINDKTAALITSLQTAGVHFFDKTMETGLIAVQVFENAIASHQERIRSRGVAHPEVEILAVWQDVLAQLGKDRLIDQSSLPQAQLAALALEYECLVNPTWPMPHLAGALGKINQEGIALGIVSNAQFYTPLLLKHFGTKGSWHHFFDQQICIWSYQLLEAKPSKNLLLKALADLQRRLNIAPRETLFVGNDLVNDIAMARSCGCKTALIALASHSPNTEIDVEPFCPDVIITDYRQLAAHL